ncbi:fluoroquinolone transport system permease protein [Haladaptatus litoreus]|uniref:Fluoroquinolone transport system permease protein n=2 Tax=Haladaptatus litoreus TaxID=553468 RepID=A0A1N7CH24_9EURY|nr:fluoroquinolone transport system permease protein [Haladaptatus litoreus]
MIGWDVRLQVKYGFYTVYAVLTLAFIVGLQAVGPDLRTDAAVLLIVTDPTILGFYFIASMVLFEKEEGVLDALVVSPLGDRGYLASKVLTLSLLAVVASTLVAVLGHGRTSRLGILIGGVCLSATLFVLIGFVVVARYDSVNEYFISAVGWGTVLFLPLFGYVGIIETPLFYLLPAQPVLLLVEGGFRSLPAWQLFYGVGYLLVANVVAYLWARRTFRQHVVRGGDPGRQLGRDTVPQTHQQHGRSRLVSRSPWVGLLLADFRNWVRDPMLAIAAVGPLALAVVVRFGAPIVADLAASVFALEPFYPVVVASMVAFGPAIYGFIVGMFVLEDREQGVLAAYRVSPLSARGYLLYRGISAYALSLVATLPALAVIGLVQVPPAVLVGSAAVGALSGPTIALVFGTVASNTIEGIAISKLINLVILGPVVGIVVVSEPLQLAVGVLPTYWPIKAVVSGVAGEALWPVFLFVGVVVHLLVISGLGHWFARRAD